METVVMALLERPWLLPLGVLGWVGLCLLGDLLLRRRT